MCACVHTCVQCMSAEEHIECFLALVDVAQLVFAVGECDVDADTLERFIERHLKLYVEVYGESKVLPKHNYCLMLPHQLRTWGLFVRAFVSERRHRLPKKFGFNRKNDKSFELGLMEDMTVVHMQMLEEVWHKKGARGYTKPRPATRRTLEDLHPTALEEPLVANVWRTLKGNTITTGDIVLFDNLQGTLEFGELVLLYKAEDVDYAILFAWERLSQLQVDSVRVLARQRALRVDARCLVTALVVSKWLPDGAAVVLLPLQFR